MEVIVAYFKLLTKQNKNLRQPIMKVPIGKASVSSSDEMAIGD
jgi:hypothetical protein